MLFRSYRRCVREVAAPWSYRAAYSALHRQSIFRMMWLCEAVVGVSLDSSGLAAFPTSYRSVPGVLVHAQILRNMLNGGLLRPVAAWIVYALCFAGAALVLLRSGALATSLLLGTVACTGLVALSLLDSGRLMEVAAPWFAAGIAVSLRFVDDAIAQARERATLRNAFGGYVSPQIMDEILAGRITPQLGGRRERVCVERGSIEYSAVTQPFPFPAIQSGTFSSMETVQRTWVLPERTSTEPSA